MSAFVTLRPHLERSFESARLVRPFSPQAQSAAHVKKLERAKWISG
jgi:hypothetical protein